MFVLIWVTLFFSVRDINADTGASVGGRPVCLYGFCITLNEGEITAEAGLCAVIPCSFTFPYYFVLQNLVWFKCEPSKERCVDSDIILHNKNNRKVQSEFKGRVSLLEPDVNQNNCSIIVNDLTESDSGSYQLRINRYSDGFTFTPRATVSVKDLTQKPTVTIPPLTAGQQTTLTCTAPGLCSGSEPTITWMWRGGGENDSHITGNITSFKTESLTSVTQRHISTLTFDPSAEHHGTKVTCKVSFINDISTEETVTLNVTYVKEAKITGNKHVKEGETLNLSCSVESFPPSLFKWTKFPDRNTQNETEPNLQNNTSADLQNDTSTNLLNETLTDLKNDTETYLQEESGLGTLLISNVSVEDSGQYVCIVKHLNNTLMKEVDIAVIYMRKPVITGKTSVEKGHALNLTCSVQSFPLSRITWTKLGSNTNLHSEPDTNMSNNSYSATLVIQNVTTEDSGRYICTAEHLNTTVSVFADITVTWFSKILQNSECKVQLSVLTCVCITEGFPLPSIKWPLLKNHTEYSVMTTVSDHTVTATMTLNVKDHSNTAVECVSANENGEAKENLIIQTDMSHEKDKLTEVLKPVSWLEVIIAFLIGVLLSAAIFCFVSKWHRKKQKSFGNLDETVEMVTNQEDPLINADQAVAEYQTYYQETAEEEGRAGTAETAALNGSLNGGPEDLHYASIDFTVLKRKSPREAAQMSEYTKTEYAEIKRKVKEEREENNRDEGEMLDGKEEETKHVIPEEEEGEDMAVYSKVKDITSEI